MKKALALIIIAVIAVGSSCLLAGCGSSYDEYGFIFGTTYELTLSGSGSRDAGKAITAMLNEIESELGTAISGSDVNNINNSEVNSPIAVGELTVLMFEKSLEYYDATGGAFDPAIFPIVRLWGFSPDSDLYADRVPPSDAEIQALLPVCGMASFAYDAVAKTVTKLTAGAMLDFGAVAKGYAVKKAWDICTSFGVAEGIINIGGSVAAVGDPIKVGITNPREGAVCIASFTLSAGYTVATSGDYERYFTYQGVRYHHIIDTSTGKPVNNGVISVTVVCSDGTDADALSTSVFCLGPEEGLALAQIKGAECLIITDSMTYYKTEGFEIEMFEEGYMEAFTDGQA